MSTPSTEGPIASAGEAERVIESLNAITDQLEETIEEETAHVRAGRLRDAAELGETKAEISRRYTAETMRVIAARELIARSLPDAYAALARAARRVPGSAADQYDGAGDRPRGCRGHHPRRLGRTRPQAGALDLWSLRPRQCAKRRELTSRWRSAGRFNSICNKSLTFLATRSTSGR